jgi:hypothetical protein
MSIDLNTDQAPAMASSEESRLLMVFSSERATPVALMIMR